MSGGPMRLVSLTPGASRLDSCTRPEVRRSPHLRRAVRSALCPGARSVTTGVLATCSPVGTINATAVQLAYDGTDLVVVSRVDRPEVEDVWRTRFARLAIEIDGPRRGWLTVYGPARLDGSGMGADDGVRGTDAIVIRIRPERAIHSKTPPRLP